MDEQHCDPSDSLDDIWANAVGVHDIWLSRKCRGGKITLRFSADGRRMRTVLGAGWPVDLIVKRGPGILSLITSTVQIVIKADRQVSARFAAAECLEVLGGEWPCDETFDHILRAVNERKRYPMPTPDVPGIEGKSRSAQGQTKKDGAHSHDRHR